MVLQFLFLSLVCNVDNKKSVANVTWRWIEKRNQGRNGWPLPHLVSAFLLNWILKRYFLFWFLTVVNIKFHAHSFQIETRFVRKCALTIQTCKRRDNRQADEKVLFYFALQKKVGQLRKEKNSKWNKIVNM